MNKKILNKIIWENVYKHILIILLALVFYPLINNKVVSLGNVGFDNLLMVISILLVTVCFANFGFSYENSYIESFGIRMLSHFATFLFLLLTAWLLIVLYDIINIAFPALGEITLVFSILLYLAVALYDFWDLLRIRNCRDI